MKAPILPLLLMLFGINQTLHADIYKWTDKDGKVHYAATPPKEPQKDVKDIEDQIKANIGKVQPKANYKAAATDNTDANAKKGPDAAKEKNKNRYKDDRSPARIAYCNNLKRNIHTMENNKNNKLIKEGEKEPMSSDQIDAQLKKDKANLAKNCIGL